MPLMPGAGGRDVHPRSTHGVLVRVYPNDSATTGEVAGSGDLGLSGIVRSIVATADASLAATAYGDGFGLESARRRRRRARRPRGRVPPTEGRRDRARLGRRPGAAVRSRHRRVRQGAARRHVRAGPDLDRSATNPRPARRPWVRHVRRRDGLRLHVRRSVHHRLTDPTTALDAAECPRHARRYTVFTKSWKGRCDGAANVRAVLRSGGGDGSRRAALGDADRSRPVAGAEAVHRPLRGSAWNRHRRVGRAVAGDGGRWRGAPPHGEASRAGEGVRADVLGRGAGVDRSSPGGWGARLLPPAGSTEARIHPRWALQSMAAGYRGGMPDGVYGVVVDDEELSVSVDGPAARVEYGTRGRHC